VSLREEVTSLLQRLLQVNTANPPGNETGAAKLLREYFARSGIPCAFHAREPERANVVAVLKGGEGPSFALLSHTDTVTADPSEWERDPWSGDLVDGEVWGRGALDMKGQVAASAVAFASLWREGFRPNGDLLFVSTADEEVGVPAGEVGPGLQWLVQAHPELVRVDFALNEGGGERVVLGDQVFFLCSVAEKSSAPFVLRVRGRSGHASVPGIADNALVRASRYIGALDRLVPEPTLIPEVKRFLELTLGDAPPPEEALARARAVHPLAGELVEPLLSLTLSPTMIEASRQRNVVPALCEVTVDCRLLPGTTPEQVEPLIRAALGDGSYELEWIERWGGTRSALDTPLWHALAGVVDEVEPGARLAPICSAGFTDSHWLREAYGTQAYGFFPLRAMPLELAARLAHSADERVPVVDLELAVDVYRRVVRRLLG
jgi:acetylornithine deacetylase/succinyl-diaminopimelate desuccinylase-like protein